MGVVQSRRMKAGISGRGDLVGQFQWVPVGAWGNWLGLVIFDRMLIVPNLINSLGYTVTMTKTQRHTITEVSVIFPWLTSVSR